MTNKTGTHYYRIKHSYRADEWWNSQYGWVSNSWDADYITPTSVRDRAARLPEGGELVCFAIPGERQVHVNRTSKWS